MQKTIFDYKEYKAYLNDTIEKAPKKGHGMRSALAQAAGCQTAYISQVLNGSAHLSLEQAEGINRFLGHQRDEAQFFLLLIQYDRAGTPALKDRLRGQITELIERRLVLKNRLDVKKTLSREHQATYYSAWYYAAIHILLTIPEFRTVSAIAKRIGLPSKRVSEVLEFLISVGLAERAGDSYRVGATRIHLESDSPLIAKHHANWRMQAIQALDRGAEENLHYSSVVSVSKDDLLKIKSMLVQSIESAKAVIKDSKEETLCGFSLDFFNL
jgi:uncharacterized protein (TIGR02147 family)